MPNLNSRPASPIKMLLLGDSGSGKTGALASLAKAGYNLKIADFDNGIDILASILAKDDKALGRIEYETFTEKMRNVSGKAIVEGTPQAFSKAMACLDKWTKTGLGLGDIIVIDSLTFASKAAMLQVLAMNGRLLAPKPFQSDWGQAQDLIEGLLGLLYAQNLATNVIVCAHVAYIDISVDTGLKDSDGEPVMRIVDNKGVPMSIGRALSPRIPRYFNHSLICFREGNNRHISTKPVGIVEAKSASITAPARLPLDSGLATYFTLFQPPPANSPANLPTNPNHVVPTS